jgi:hypothetical protein
MRGAKRRMLATTSRAPRRLGTDGSQTHRRREVDSNLYGAFASSLFAVGWVTRR